MIEVVEPNAQNAEKEPGRERHYELSDFVRQLGGRIAGLRRDHRLSQAQFALLHGYHLSHWQRIEGGRNMSLPTLIRVANDFKITLEELLQGVGRLDGPAPPPRPVRHRYGPPLRNEEIDVK